MRPTELVRALYNATATCMISVGVADRAECAYPSLVIRLDMLGVDRCKTKSIAAAHLCQDSDLAPETPTHHFVLPALALPMIGLLVAVQLMLLLREEWIPDRELMAVDGSGGRGLSVIDCPLFDRLAPLLGVWRLLDIRAGEGRNEARSIIERAVATADAGRQ